MIIVVSYVPKLSDIYNKLAINFISNYSACEYLYNILLYS